MTNSDSSERKFNKGLPSLRNALIWLLCLWLVAPFWLYFGSVILGGLIPAINPLIPVVGGFLLCLGVSCYHLAQSATSRWEAWKVWTIPVFFVLLALFGGVFGHSKINSFGLQGVGFIAPVWLSEILRYKAYHLKINKSAVYFLIQHGLTLFLAIRLSLSNSWFLSDEAFIVLLMVWYFSYPMGFYLFRRQLGTLMAGEEVTAAA